MGKPTNCIELLENYVQEALERAKQRNDMASCSTLENVLSAVEGCKAAYEAEILLAKLKGQNELLVEMNEIKQSLKIEQNEIKQK